MRIAKPAIRAVERKDCAAAPLQLKFIAYLWGLPILLPLLCFCCWPFSRSCSFYYLSNILINDSSRYHLSSSPFTLINSLSLFTMAIISLQLFLPRKHPIMKKSQMQFQVLILSKSPEVLFSPEQFLILHLLILLVSISSNPARSNNYWFFIRLLSKVYPHCPVTVIHNLMTLTLIRRGWWWCCEVCCWSGHENTAIMSFIYLRSLLCTWRTTCAIKLWMNGWRGAPARHATQLLCCYVFNLIITPSIHVLRIT